MEQLPLHVRLRDYARLASFVPGQNQLALRSLESAPDAPRVVWLWGRSGSGKTHLLQAACAVAGERGDAAAYVDLAAAPSPAVLEGCEALDIVCLDGLEAVVADADWNRAIFRLHTLLHDGQGRLLLASTAAPASLSFTLPDLRSRLLAAAVHQLTPLDESGQCEALRQRAAAKGLDLSEEAALFLVHRVPRDMHTLLRVLDQLDQASLAAQRRLTIPFLRDALEALLPLPR